MYIDTHAHFDLCIENKEVNLDSLITSMKENSIEYAVQITIDAKGLEWSYNLAKKYENIKFTIGIHPSSVASEKELDQLSKFTEKIHTSDDKGLLFGIGETGLDFYRLRQPKGHQINSFENQIDLANKYKLPLIVHSRDAFDETLEILKKKKPEIGIMHCFSGGKDEARKVLDLGFYISFAGNLTYKNAKILHESASFVPLNRLLLETDAPFLTPVPFRGKKNRSDYVIHTYKFLSELRNEPLSKIKEELYNNFSILNKR